MTTVLVTGGAGFIGSHFIRLLLKHDNYFVINFDLLTYAGNLSNLTEIESNKNYCFKKGDIRDRPELENLFKNYDIDVVVNFAAESHVDRSIVAADDFITTNIIGAQTLMDVSKSVWLNSQEGKFKKGKRFIQISTDEVYGSILYGSFDESSNILPNSPYSASKASADLIARSYYMTFNFPVIITRSSNNYGVNQYPEKLIPFFLSLAKKDRPLPLYGDGKQVRDWIHVEDNCAAILEVMSSGVIGEIYNVGANNEIQNIDIAKMILKELNKSKSLIAYINDRPGHDIRYSIDSNKIRNKLGWKPQKDFRESFKELVRNSF